MGYRVGVDIGGTFTDFCVFNDATNDLFTLKTLSTPANPGSEVMAGIQLIQERYHVDPADVDYFTHGTTVGINTVLQRNGASLCLFTTENYGDVLEMQRLKMPNPYNLYSTRAASLISKDKVFPLRERTLSDGSIDLPLDRESVAEAVARVRAMSVEGVIISLINAFRNPVHELQAKAIVNEIAPELFVFCSTEVWPIIREYERTITTVINGYVHPKVSFYLSSLQKALKDKGVHADPLITKSNGGVMGVESGKSACVQILLSGTASGVMGASYITNLCSIDNVVSLDIGGTSADVSLIMNGKPQYGTGEHIGEFTLYIPTVSVTSIGDGGGSIAWVDEFGVLKVGPESAGADPGPACYGQGGTRPTITDAFAVCGFLGQSQLAYNSVSMHLDRAEQVVAELSAKLNRGLLEGAEALIKVAVSGMFTELSKLFAKNGCDPRDFALLAFGGAGPMACCFLARELGIRKVVIPTAPGVLSALGGLISDIKNDFIKTVFLDLEKDSAVSLQQGFEELRVKADAWLRQEQGYGGEATLIYSGDMRYRGQSFEIDVPFEESWIQTGDLERIARAFHDSHEQIYDYCDREAPIQVINVRLVIAGVSPKPEFKRMPETPGTPQPVKMIDVYYDGTMHNAPLYRREDLRAGYTLIGPAVIVQDDTTTCVLEGFNGKVDPYGNILLDYEL